MEQPHENDKKSCEINGFPMVSLLFRPALAPAAAGGIDILAVPGQHEGPEHVRNGAARHGGPVPVARGVAREAQALQDVLRAPRPPPRALGP